MNDFTVPKGEVTMVAYLNASGDTIFVLTRKQQGDSFCLYEVKEGNLNRVGKGKSPKELEEKYGVVNKMNA